MKSTPWSSVVRDLLRDAPTQLSGKDKDALRSQLFETLFKKLGFKRYDANLVEEVARLAEQFGKQKTDDAAVKRLRREDLELICFDYVSG